MINSDKQHNDELLQRIANHLIINSSYLDNLGLFHGKMGVVIFFYHYSRYTSNPIYEEFAGELLDEIFEEIHDKLPIDFENGYLGIGWGIEYLAEQKFIDGDANDILEDIDKKIMERDIRRISDMSLNTGLEGVFHYVLARSRNNEDINPLSNIIKMKSPDNFFVTISLFLIFILSITKCTSSNTSDKDAKIEKKNPVIDLATAIETSGKPLNLSNFIEDIEYIRPEYPATLVDFIFGISINDRYLLLEVRDRLLCYTRDGKFIREIGRKGQGPKEHLGIRSSALYDNFVAINSNYNRKILWYNINGDYLKETPVSDNVFKINILDTNRVAIHLQHGITMNDPNLFVTGVLDHYGDTIQLKKTTPYYPKGMTTSPCTWKFDNIVRVFTCLNDTVYSVSRNEITPAYIINFGKYKVDTEAFDDIRLLEEERSKYIINPSFCENSQYVLTMFQFDNKRWVAMYNKKTAEISAFSIKPENVNKHGFLEGGGWINDIDGGVAPTYFNSISNNYFAINVQPEDLKTQFFENKKNISVKYPDKQQKLEELINTLRDEENPIIILYKLKK